MKSRINLITLGVADLEKSLVSYRDESVFSTTRSASNGIIFFQTTGNSLASIHNKALADDVSEEFNVKKSRPYGRLEKTHL